MQFINSPLHSIRPNFYDQFLHWEVCSSCQDNIFYQMWDNQHYCPISFYEPAVYLMRILTLEHTTSKNLSCLGKSCKPPLSQSKTKTSLNVRFRLIPRLINFPCPFSIEASLKLESIQLDPPFNSVSCNNPDLRLPSSTAYPSYKFLIAINYFSPLSWG